MSLFEENHFGVTGQLFLALKKKGSGCSDLHKLFWEPFNANEHQISIYNRTTSIITDSLYFTEQCILSLEMGLDILIHSIAQLLMISLRMLIHPKVINPKIAVDIFIAGCQQLLNAMLYAIMAIIAPVINMIALISCGMATLMSGLPNEADIPSGISSTSTATAAASSST